VAKLYSKFRKVSYCPHTKTTKSVMSGLSAVLEISLDEVIVDM
jgi:hypothetical protein